MLVNGFLDVLPTDVGIVSGLDLLDEESLKLTELTLDSSALLYPQAKRFSVKFLLVIGIASPLEEPSKLCQLMLDVHSRDPRPGSKALPITERPQQIAVDILRSNL